MRNIYYYLCEDDSIIRIISKRRPSLTTRPITGTWILSEYNGKKWEMPCFPEITWNRLSQLKFIGKLPLIIKES